MLSGNSKCLQFEQIFLTFSHCRNKCFNESNIQATGWYMCNGIFFLLPKLNSLS